MKRKVLCLLGISAALLNGCGGSGDDGVVIDVPDPPPLILPTYNFEIGGLDQGPDLRVDVGGQFDVTVDFGDTLRGSTDLQVSLSNEVMFESYTTDAGSTLDVTVSRSQTTLDGSFTMNVTSDVFAFVNGGPTSGAFEVVTPNDTVTVTLVLPGVEMSLNGGAAVPFTLQEYEDLLDDPQAETWQRQASLAGAIYAFVFERVFEFADLLDELEITESINPIVTSCDMFPGALPPGVAIAQGENVLTRLGSSEDLMPGDVFDWTFTECWFADSNVLINNFVQLQNYIEVIDENNTLRRIGFASANNMPGGIVFFDWRLAETQENNGLFTIDPADVVEVDGGFSMVFFYP